MDDGTQSLSMASMAGTGDLTFRGPAAAAAAAAAAATMTNPLSISVEHLGAETLAAMLVKGGLGTWYAAGALFLLQCIVTRSPPPSSGATLQ